MYKVVHEEPAPLSTVNPDLPPHLQEVINRACAKDREPRYQDALELKRDLEGRRAPAAAAPAAVPAAPPGPRQEAVPPAPVPAHIPPPPVSVPPVPAKRRYSAKMIFAIIAVAVILFAGVLTAIILATSSSSSETSMVIVPDLEGATWEEARSEAEDVGLDIEKSEVSTDEFPEGEVISQDPAAGDEVEEGSTVNVDVAVAVSDDTQDDTDGDDTTGGDDTTKDDDDVTSGGNSDFSFDMQEIGKGNPISGLKVTDISWSDKGEYFRIVFEFEEEGGGEVTKVPNCRTWYTGSGSEGHENYSEIYIALDDILPEQLDDAAFAVADKSVSLGDPLIETMERVSSGDTEPVFFLVRCSYSEAHSGVSSRPHRLLYMSDPMRVILDIQKM